MRDETPSVLIIDDDPEFRDSVARLLRTVGLHTREFSSVSDYLQADPPDGLTCLVLDVRMPGRSGLELQRDLVAAASAGWSSRQRSSSTGACRCRLGPISANSISQRCTPRSRTRIPERCRVGS